jgi:C1A family cysteine protease
VTRRWGYRPDPHDPRDRPLGALLGHLAASPPPASASLLDPRVTPKNQGQTSSCTGQAWSQAVRLGLLHKGRSCPELSALHSYYTNRAELGWQADDGGAYLRTGAAAAIRFGIAHESAWPFRESLVNIAPGLEAMRSAHPLHGSRGYHRVDLRKVDDVRRAIAAGYAVVGGWDVDEAFENFDGIGVISKPDPKKVLGGHALCIAAYSADGTFSVLNSWSSSWGLNGLAVCDDEWIASGTDGWVVEVGS